MSNIIDISLEISEHLTVWPGEQVVDIQQTSSMDTGDNCNVAFFTMGMHAGTHVDVPLHFVRDGKDTATIELDRFVGRAKVFEFDSQVEVDVAALEGLDIIKDYIVLLKALKNEKLLRDSAFNKDYVYLSTEAAAFLVQKGIKLNPDPKDLALGYFLLADLYHRQGKMDLSTEYARKGEELARASGHR